MIGIFGVIASLMFVGLQLKQSQEIAVSAAYQARADASNDITVTAFNTPEFTSIVAKNLCESFRGHYTRGAGRLSVLSRSFDSHVREPTSTISNGVFTGRALVDKSG